jgi:cellobiose phosphorylase
MDEDLSGAVGTTLDPIFALRKKISIEAGRRVQLSFITGISGNREEALALVEKYKDLAASHRAIELAWNYAQLELRHLKIQQEEMQLFQKLASRIVYPHRQLRATERRLHQNQLGQAGLWAQGISGDFPIVVVTVGDLYDVDLVKELLVAHAFWSLRGLRVDLIILNEEEIGYMEPLHDQLSNMVQAHMYRNPNGKQGASPQK